ncbi:hypothetical protein [Agromyces humi]|uniref:hypothetical protein n=1 Tax=Agromyces humi TaxID=1766800 RepID=UPI00135B6C25|nr:hypothetical protein [Agromyces humi]
MTTTTNPNNGHDGWKHQARRTDGEFGEKLHTPAEPGVLSDPTFRFAADPKPLLAQNSLQIAQGLLGASEVTVDGDTAQVSWNQVDFMAMAAEANGADIEGSEQKVLRWLFDNRDTVEKFLAAKNITLTGDEWDEQTLTVKVDISGAADDLSEDGSPGQRVVLDDNVDYAHNALGGDGTFAADLVEHVRESGIGWDGIYSTPAWEERYRPIVDKNGEYVRYDDVTDIPAGTPENQIWGIRHDDGFDGDEDDPGYDEYEPEWSIEPGYVRVNNAGYFVTAEPWGADAPDVRY